MKFKEIESNLKKVESEILKKILQEINQISPENTEELCKKISKNVSEEVKKLEYNFKFVLNSYIFHKNNTSVNMNSTCIIDVESDGSISIKEEKDDYIIIVNTYGISLE